jgi:hypothetical protein
MGGCGKPLPPAQKAIGANALDEALGRVASLDARPGYPWLRLAAAYERNVEYRLSSVGGGLVAAEKEVRDRIRGASVLLVGDDHIAGVIRERLPDLVEKLTDGPDSREVRLVVEALPRRLLPAVESLTTGDRECAAAALYRLVTRCWPYPVAAYEGFFQGAVDRGWSVYPGGGSQVEQPEMSERDELRRPIMSGGWDEIGEDFMRTNKYVTEACVGWASAQIPSRLAVALVGALHFWAGKDSVCPALDAAGTEYVVLIQFNPGWELALRRRNVMDRWVKVDERVYYGPRLEISAMYEALQQIQKWEDAAPR